MSLDLEKQLTFYGSYHHTKANVAIHMVCVPIILISAITLATNTPVFIHLPDWLEVKNLPLNLGTIAAIGYSLFYLLLEPVAGALVIPILLGATAYGNHLHSVDPSTTNKVALVVQVVSWILQFVGHGVFEKRAPALLDNLIQALVLAPFFVWMEVLFKFGYRPELQSRVEKAVEKELAALKAANAKNGKAA